MTDERAGHTEGKLLITVDSSNVPVSSLSSLLRVLQAALREIARGQPDTREQFAQQPQPVLYLSTDGAEEGLVLRLTFGGASDSAPMPELSSSIFGAFVEQLGQLIKRMPQRSLWGEPVGGPPVARQASAVEGRLDQVRMELRRLSRASVSFDGHTISFEGDRMEIT